MAQLAFTLESTVNEDSNHALNLDVEPLPVPDIPDELILLAKPQQLFNVHFEKIKWTSSGGSSLGYSLLVDTGTPDFYCPPESARTGQFSMFEAGEPARDSLYRGSSLTFFKPLKNGDELFAEFYSRKYQYPYRPTLESAPQEVNLRGVNVGIKF